MSREERDEHTSVLNALAQWESAFPGKSAETVKAERDAFGSKSAVVFSPPLDEGIKQAVQVLVNAGVETFESCQGGKGHSYAEPTVRFYGGKAEGFKALAVALQAGLKVGDLRRVWPVLDDEPTGPWWELTFTPDKNSPKD